MNNIIKKFKLKRNIANARKWKHQEGGVLKGQWGLAVDNTRVVGSDGMTAELRVQMQEQLQKAKAVRARYLEELRLRNQPLLSEWTSEEQAASDRIKAEKERNEWLYKNLHLWNIDPTQKVTRDNVQFTFNNAGLAGEPIRLGLGLALGAGAIRQIPGIISATGKGIRALPGIAKNEAQMFAGSFRGGSNNVYLQTLNRVVNPKATPVNGWEHMLKYELYTTPVVKAAEEYDRVNTGEWNPEQDKDVLSILLGSEATLTDLDSLNSMMQW